MQQTADVVVNQDVVETVAADLAATAVSGLSCYCAAAAASAVMAVAMAVAADAAMTAVSGSSCYSAAVAASAAMAAETAAETTADVDANLTFN